MGKPYVKVVISVLNWNNADETVLCIESIIRSIDSRIGCHIIISDNDSYGDDVHKIRNKFPSLELIVNSTNLGYSEGHYQAYLHAVNDWNFDLFWILNNDLVIERNTLPALLLAYSEVPEAIFGSVVIDNIEDRIVSWGGTIELRNWDNIPGDFPIQHIGEHIDNIPGINKWVATLNGCSILIPRVIIEKEGFLSPDYFMYHEETAYCLGLLKKRIKSIVVQNSVVAHNTSFSSKRFPEIKGVLDYYRSRNIRILIKSIYNRSWLRFLYQDIFREDLVVNLLKFLLKKVVNKKDEQYYTTLATIHFYFQLKGRTLNPNEYISR